MMCAMAGEPDKRQRQRQIVEIVSRNRVDSQEELLDLLHTMRLQLGTAQPFEVISGYRSPETNEMLRKRGAGVGKNSLHMQGMAIDVRVPGRRLKDVRRVARELKRGGVGYYPRSNFVHVDVGKVRYW